MTQSVAPPTHLHSASSSWSTACLHPLAPWRRPGLPAPSLSPRAPSPPPGPPSSPRIQVTSGYLAAPNADAPDPGSDPVEHRPGLRQTCTSQEVTCTHMYNVQWFNGGSWLQRPLRRHPGRHGSRRGEHSRTQTRSGRTYPPRATCRALLARPDCARVSACCAPVAPRHAFIGLS